MIQGLHREFPWFWPTHDGLTIEFSQSFSLCPVEASGSLHE
jgi:hypothetical protein